MPIMPTLWWLEELPLRQPAEILVTGGDAPADADAADTAARHATAQPRTPDLDAGDVATPRVAHPVGEPAMPVDAVVQARPSDTGGAALADGTVPDLDEPSRLVVEAPASDAAGQGAMPAEAELDPPAADAFPTLAALDAIRAAFATDPPGPDAAARADFAALLGLDPPLAADEAAFMDALRDAPAPGGAALLAEWLSEAAAEVPPPWAVPAEGWLLG